MMAEKTFIGKRNNSMCKVQEENSQVLGLFAPGTCNTVIISCGSRKAESYRQVFDPLIHLPWLIID